MNDRRFKFGYLLILLAGFGAMAVLWQQQAIADWWKLRGYEPTPDISALALATTMTDDAKRLFYINHPQLIADSDQFRQNCPISEQTIILGCYHSRQSGIHIYDVSDSRLDGVEQVTAAHEMLHAYYERLGGEKTKVDQMLQNFFATGNISERVKQTIALYEKSEPDDIINEMHSIFGTEIADLPPELEGYYGRYFSNRQQVVGYSEGYEDEFQSRLSRITVMDDQLAALKSQIDAEEEALSSQRNDIENLRSQLDYKKFNGDFNGYNDSVDYYNAQITIYNRGVISIKAKIDSYNQLVAERNALAVELKGLEQAIDTRLTTESP
ncbi:hypothetical protein A3A68_00240 [Candidatus Saccharibacteria bacterium RIFCSPLOWO2_01_FULL_48_13]|nr:MAG: hypothetical protein A2884_01440 [Candidatus Saccharibacteria bacterium RIFCSPHIGHO2_01_FULL_48_12]OGL35946.1 MAG: hypothetical protein A3F38_02520 [Candidatus Saccharibacteria bacterium RIFCSPHIGHO2_12_FULL_48_21]OGL36997.1 MAG: hypothetical protein A3A68_00240 [Candidatus Saccharibacteria bacterium RIFCSPLOWO2_01_FULL_48_13]